MTWHLWRHQLLPEREQGLTKSEEDKLPAGPEEQVLPLPPVFSVRFKDEKYSEKPIWERVFAARESEKAFQAAQPAEAADDFVVAPIRVGCDFLQQSSTTWEPRCQGGACGVEGELGSSFTGAGLRPRDPVGGDGLGNGEGCWRSPG